MQNLISPRIIGPALAIGFYLSLLLFLVNYGIKGLIWVKGKPSNGVRSGTIKLRTFLKALCDIVFFRRLLYANDVLWIGEWIFHLSFVVVMFRHLRYFLVPVPQWVWSVQTPGIIAGYVLSASLVYVFVVKFLVERKKYFSSYNFLLLMLILLLSVSGLLMKTIYHPNIISVKEFMMGIMSFRFGPVPDSFFFIFHFVLVLALIMNLPTHIFAAPLTLLGARQREEDLRRVIHEE